MRLSHLFWSAVHTVLERGFNILFVIVLGQIIDPGSVGIYVSLTLATGYVASIFIFDIGSGLVQRLNDDGLKAQRNVYFTAGFVSHVVMALSVTVTAYCVQSILIDLFQLEAHRDYLIAFIPIIFIRVSREFLNRILQADSRFFALALTNGIACGIELGVAVVIILKGSGVIGAIVGAYLGNVFSLIVLMLIILKTYRFEWRQSIWPEVKSLLRFSALLQLGLIAVFLDKNIDLFFVNYYLEKADLATYNYALKLGLLFLVLANSISSVAFPQLTQRYSAEGQASVDRLYQRALNGTFFLMSALSVCLLILYPYVFPWILPDYYESVRGPFLIVMTAVVFLSPFNAMGMLLVALNKVSYAVLLNWVALIVNAVLCWILIPRMGMLGAALSTAVSFGLRVPIRMFSDKVLGGITYPYVWLMLAFCLYGITMALIQGMEHIGFQLVLAGIYFAAVYWILIQRTSILSDLLSSMKMGAK